MKNLWFRNRFIKAGDLIRPHLNGRARGADLKRKTNETAHDQSSNSFNAYTNTMGWAD